MGGSHVLQRLPNNGGCGVLAKLRDSAAFFQFLALPLPLPLTSMVRISLTTSPQVLFLFIAISNSLPPRQSTCIQSSIQIDSNTNETQTKHKRKGLHHVWKRKGKKCSFCWKKRERVILYPYKLYFRNTDGGNIFTKEKQGNPQYDCVRAAQT